MTTLKEVGMLKACITGPSLQNKFEDEFRMALEQNENLNYVHYMHNDTKTSIQSMFLKAKVLSADNDSWKHFSLDKFVTS